MRQMIKDIFRQYREKLSYVVAGAMTSLIAWGTYAFFIYAECSINVSNILSWIIAVLFSYLINKVFVFQASAWKISQVFKEITTFVSSRLLTGAIEIISVPFFIWLGITQSFAGIEGFGAKFLAGLLPLVMNYVLGKGAVFRVRKKH